MNAIVKNLALESAKAKFAKEGPGQPFEVMIEAMRKDSPQDKDVHWALFRAWTDRYTRAEADAICNEAAIPDGPCNLTPLQMVEHIMEALDPSSFQDSLNTYPKHVPFYTFQLMWTLHQNELYLEDDQLHAFWGACEANLSAREAE